MELLLVLAAVICWGIGAITGFGWFGAAWEVQKIIGIVSLGLFFIGLYWLLPGAVARVRREPPA